MAWEVTQCRAGHPNACSAAERELVMGEWTPGQLTQSELAERLRLLGKLDAILTEIRVRPMRRQLPLDQQQSPIAEALASSRTTSAGVRDRARTSVPDRLDHLRIRVGASVSFDTDALTWVVVVVGMGNDPDEIVQSPSITVVCDALDALVTRRSAHIEESTRAALVALAVCWALDFRVGYD
jgi:hypothetical protein